MNPHMFLAIIGIAPILLILAFRANAALVFFALCAGNVLQLFVGDDTQKILQGLFNNYSNDIGIYIRLVLMFIPPFLAIIFLRSSVKGLKTLMNIFPAITVGITNLFLAVPLLPKELKGDILATSFWREISTFQALLIGLSVTISLIIVLSGKRSHRRGRHKGLKI